jgi:uncharacterized RDD family membrane protein YckC
MSSILATILFVEFERGPAASVLDVLKDSGGTRCWSEGRRFIIRFQSPTAAIVASEFVLGQVASLNTEDGRFRFFIDTGEVSFDGSLPVGPAMALGWSMLSRGIWNMVYFSESTRLTLRHSEHCFLARPEEWLEPGVGKVALHRLTLNYSESRIERGERTGEVFANLCAIRPAPHGRRALAGLIDFLLAVLVLLSWRIVVNAPLVLGVISTRKVIEAESMKIRHGYISPTWLASSGAVVALGRNGSIMLPFPYETGTYQVRVIYRYNGVLGVEVGVGDRQFKLPLISNSRRFLEAVLDERIHITNGEPFILKKGDIVENPDIDYVQFIATDDRVYSRKEHEDILRSEDFLRLIGVWHYDDLKYHAWDLFVLCPVIQMLLHIVFLTFVPWTPGAHLAGIRIVSRKGRRVPGLLKGASRALGYVLSIIPFVGVGLIWPLIVNKSENWADVFSETRVIASGERGDEE